MKVQVTVGPLRRTMTVSAFCKLAMGYSKAETVKAFERYITAKGGTVYIPMLDGEMEVVRVA